MTLFAARFTLCTHCCFRAKTAAAVAADEAASTAEGEAEQHPGDECAVGDALRDLSGPAVRALEILLANQLDNLPTFVGDQSDEAALPVPVIAPTDRVAVASVIVRAKRAILRGWQTMLRGRWELIQVDG